MKISPLQHEAVPSDHGEHTKTTCTNIIGALLHKTIARLFGRGPELFMARVPQQSYLTHVLTKGQDLQTISNVNDAD